MHDNGNRHFRGAAANRAIGAEGSSGVATAGLAQLLVDDGGQRLAGTQHSRELAGRQTGFQGLLYSHDTFGGHVVKGVGECFRAIAVVVISLNCRLVCAQIHDLITGDGGLFVGDLSACHCRNQQGQDDRKDHN